jgi:hypothetical protein
MPAAEDYSISSLPVAPPVVSAWPERNGKPRVDLTQLHMNLALIEKQSRQSLDHSTDDERTADAKTSSPLARTNSIRSGGGDTHSEAVLQQPNQHCSLKRVRFSDAPPTVIVYEQVNILEGEIITRNMSIRRRNVDLSPVKNHKYEGNALIRPPKLVENSEANDDLCLKYSLSTGSRFILLRQLLNF